MNKDVLVTWMSESEVENQTEDYAEKLSIKQKHSKPHSDSLQGDEHQYFGNGGTLVTLWKTVRDGKA